MTEATTTDLKEDAATAAATTAGTTTADATVTKDDKAAEQGASNAQEKTDATTEKTGPDNSWRDEMSGGDEDIAKAIARYGSPKGVAKALRDAQKAISEGRFQKGKPDESDAKAMAEWRKEQGIPDDPTGYTLPDPILKSLSDADKPALAAFTEFAHKKGAPQSAVELGVEWYAQLAQANAERESEAAKVAAEQCDDKLRGEWAAGEYKGNLNLAKRFLDDSPLGAEGWATARLADGRMLGNVPEFLMWASDQARSTYGDAAFANSDVAKRHDDRKAEIEKIMSNDIDSYYRDGMDKEYAKILETESRRRK